MEVAQQVLGGGETRVRAQVRLACVDRITFRPVRIPKAIIARTGTTL